MKAKLKAIIKYILEYPIHFCVLSKKSLLKKTNWIRRLLNRYLFALKLMPNYPFRIFAARYVRFINKNMYSDKTLYQSIKKMWIETYKTYDERYKLLMSKVFYTFNILDDEVCELLIKDSTSFKNNDYKRWMFYDISRMSFFFPESIYPGYYNDRRELLISVSKDNEITFENKGERSGIAILVYTLGDDLFNGATRLAKMVSDGLIPYEEKISVICLDSFCISKKERKRMNTIFEIKNPNNLYDSVKKILNQGVSLHLIGMGDRKEKDDKLVSLLNDINPKVIIDITDEYSYQSYFYSQVYPTIYIPMRNYSSSSFYTATLGVKWKYELLNSKYHSVDENKIIEWSFPEYVPPKSVAIARDELGLREDSFVIVTIGKNENEFSNEFIDSICNMIADNKDIQWLIVGGNPPLYLKYKYGELVSNKSIIIRTFEKNLSGLCKSCDVVLRANTTAGSGGTAIAAMSGCPIVMTNMVCDPMRWLGKDYSSISKVEDLPSEILKLKNDKEYYSNKQSLCKKLVLEATDSEKRWKQLAGFIKDMENK